MICLTFDTDWMSEETLARFLRECPLPGTATFFCHEPFGALSETRHELCPHPFITNLSDWRDDCQRLVARIGRPARGTRAHSCVHSHMMGVELHEMGFEYVSQASALFQPQPAPFRHPWGIWEMPIYYMDNMDFWTPLNWPKIGHVPFASEWIRQSLAGAGLYVYDFHPIHLALNTRTPDDYRQVRDRIVNDGQSPFDLAFPGRGAREYFYELCEAMASAGAESHSCLDALHQWQHAAMSPA